MKTDQLSELSRMITGTVQAYPDNRKLLPALKAIQWRLRSADGRYVQALTVATLAPAKALGPVESAVIFDGRDNEAHKLRFFSAWLHTELLVEILPQLVNS